VTPRHSGLRLAVLSHSAVERSHQRKWELAAAAGWTVLLLVPRKWQEGSRWIRGESRRSGRLFVETVRGPGEGRVARWLPLGLGRRLAGFSPDLVYAEEEFYSLACRAAARAARKMDVPFAFFTWENISRKYRFLQERLIPRVLAGASGAVAGNAEAARVLRKRGLRGPVAVIPQYGVDREVFSPRRRAACRRALGWPAEGAIFGYVGRLLREKGVETLLSAVARAGGGARAAIVGAGPHEEALRRDAGALLPGRALFHSPVERSRVAVVMGALDALVLPSRTTGEWKEQFGRVLVEALACGRPAFGSDSGEILSVLGDRRFVFHEGDAAGLARKLRGVRRYRSLVPALRRRALARFSEEAVARATTGFLRGLVKS